MIKIFNFELEFQSGLLDCVFVYIVLYQLKSVVFGILGLEYNNDNTEDLTQ